MTKPTILLVHGAWHDSRCWDLQIPALQTLGYETATLDLPCTASIHGTTQFDDAAAVHATLEPLVSAGKRVLVLGHSYGAQIASAGVALLEDKTNVVGLVVLCGYLFPGGMDQRAVIESIGLPYAIWDSPSEGFWLPNSPRELFYKPDVPAGLEEVAVGRLKPQAMTTQLGFVPPQVWQEGGFEGLAYIRTTEDGILLIKDQDGMIEAAGGDEKWVVRTLEGSSHSPFLSRPEELAAVIDELVGVLEAKA